MTPTLNAPARLRFNAALRLQPAHSQPINPDHWLALSITYIVRHKSPQSQPNNLSDKMIGE